MPNAEGQPETPPALLRVREISKQFPGVRALKQVSLTVGRGEVIAVIGENGAGKSTLMKILAGVQTPDSGEILINEEPVRIDSVLRALELGIALIHQELNLCDNLDVTANIFLGREPTHCGFFKRRAMEQEARDLLARVGLDVSPRALVKTLSIGQQQLVEIAKAVSVNARVVIMDEPTSSLSHGESEKLFQVIRELRAAGVSIVYISHRLGEVKDLADRVVVLRDGENAGELAKGEIGHDRMVQMMVGRDVSQFYVREPHQPGAVVLAVKNLVTPAYPRERLTFSIRAGEIVGVAGLVGAGRTEMLRVLFGVDQPVAGEVFVCGKQLESRKPADAISAGIGLVPEDRKEEGLLLGLSVRGNISLPGLRRNARQAGIVNRLVERQHTAEMIAKLRIKTPGELQIVQLLSGGNQQKVVLGKWLSLNPRVLLLDEPTRGIDVGAKQEIYQLMEQLAREGVAILFVSSEMEEVLGMSDRTLVMHEGRLTGELSRSELSEEAVMRLATGQTNQTAKQPVSK